MKMVTHRIFPHPHILFCDIRDSPHRDSSHAVGENGEEGGGGLRVVGPALAGSTPQFKEVGDIQKFG